MTELTFKAVEETETPEAATIPARWIRKTVEHFDNACDKHPYFVDGASFVDSIYAEGLLRVARESLARRIKNKLVTIASVAEVELAEVEEALARGDDEHAIEECYDVIAVMLRAITYIEEKRRKATSE